MSEFNTKEEELNGFFSDLRNKYENLTGTPLSREDEIDFEFNPNGEISNVKIKKSGKEEVVISVDSERFSLTDENVKQFFGIEGKDKQGLSGEIIENILDNINIDFTIETPGLEEFGLSIKETEQKQTFEEYIEDFREQDITGKDLEDIISSGKPFLTEEEKLEEDANISDVSFKEKVAKAVENEKTQVDNVVKQFERAFYVDPKEIGNSLYSQMLDKISLIDLLKFLVSCLPVKPGKFVPLTFDFLPKIPTIDLMLSIDIALSTMLQQIFASLLEFLSGLADTVCAISRDIGASAIQDYLNSGLPGSKVLQAFENAGVIEFQRPQNSADSGLDLGDVVNNNDLLKEIGLFLDSVSSVLSPFELAKLLSGDSVLNSRKVILSLANVSTFSFKNNLTDTRIQVLFKEIGKLADDERMARFLSTCGTSKMDIVGDKLVCPDIDGIQKSLLENKGLSPEEVNKLLDDAKKAKEKRINDFNQFIDRINNGDTPINPFCPDNGINLPGISQPPKVEIPKSVERQLDSALNTMFDGVYTTFDKEALAWNESILEVSNVLQNNENGVEFVEAALNKIKNKEQLSKDEQKIKSLQMQTVFDPEKFIEVYDTPEKKLKLIEGNSFTVSKLVAPALLNVFKFLKTKNEYYKVVNGEHILTVNVKDAFGSSNGANFLNEEIKVGFLTKNLIKTRSGAAYEEKEFSIKEKNPEDSISDKGVFPIPNDIRESIYEKTTAQQIENPQREIFLSLMKELYLGYAKDETKIEKFVDTAYQSFSSAMLGTVAEVISKTNLFSKVGDNLKLQLIKFNKKKKICECKDPHILNLDEIKKRAKEQFKNENCKQPPMKEKNGVVQSTRPGPLEKSLISGVVETTIRAYMIDFFLRGVLVFNEFGLQRPLEKFLKDFIIKEFKRELKLFGEAYLNAFLSAIKKVYLETYGELSVTQLVEKDFELGFFIETQLVDIYEKIQDGILEIKNDKKPVIQRFLFDWIPLFDVAVPEANLENLSRKVSDSPIMSQRSAEKTLPILTNQAPYKNFILEKYYRLERETNSRIPNNSRNAISEAESSGVKSTEEWENYFNNLPLGNKINEVWSKISYGIRVSYVGERNEENLEFNRAVAKRERIGKVFESDNKVNNNRNLTCVVPIYSFEIDASPELLNKKIGEYKFSWESRREELMNSVEWDNQFKVLFDYCFRIERIVTALTIYSIIFMRYLNGGAVARAFFGTKEQLRSLFYSILNSGNYTDVDGQLDPFLKSIGGQKGLNSLLSVPPEKLSGAELKKLINMPGFNYWQIIKFVLETPVQIFRGLTEIADPNIFIASKMALFSRILGGVDIPVSLFSMSLMPSTVFPGSWYGPPLTPLGFIYLALSLGFSLGNFTGTPEEIEDLKSGNIAPSSVAGFFPEGMFDKNPEDCDKCDEEDK